MSSTNSKPPCKFLVLDAGPLLSLSPLRGLAEKFVTVPQVLAELKDPKARQYFEQLGLSVGVSIGVEEPDQRCLAEVIQFAKKTGDYSVLSHADLCVIALTLSIDRREKEAKESKERPPADGESSETLENSDDLSQLHGLPEGNTEVPSEVPAISETGAKEVIENVAEEDAEPAVEDGSNVDGEGEGEQPLQVTLVPVDRETPHGASTDEALLQNEQPAQDEVLFEDPSDEDDGEGDWVTPSNIAIYKSQALDLVPSSDPFTVASKKHKPRRKFGNKTNGAALPPEDIAAGCMTADFAMQNVILQMGLNLVGLEGKRIQKVKNWVLRCHACFKICKDNSKKFCPSCGNPTLLRTSVTISSPGADGSAPAMQVHLKKNFVYRNRGTKYSIPTPKSGTSKTGSGEGLILREDQTTYMRAMKHEAGRREREEKKLLQGAVAAAKTGSGTGVQIGSWTDPDWTPAILSVAGPKGRIPNSRAPLGADGMPVIGYGKKNPNERRRRK